MDTTKIRAIQCKLDGIEFRSKIERDCYARMKQLKIKCKYEDETIELFPAFRYQGHAFKAITHTPDFVITPPRGCTYKKIYLEVKGYDGDTDGFRVRQRLFLSSLQKKKNVLYLMAWDTQFIDKLYNFFNNDSEQPKLVLRQPKTRSRTTTTKKKRSILGRLLW